MKELVLTAHALRMEAERLEALARYRLRNTVCKHTRLPYQAGLAVLGVTEDDLLWRILEEAQHE